MYKFRSYIPKFIANNNPIKFISNKYYGSKFLLKEPTEIKLVKNEKTEEEIEIYIVAFNNDIVIEKQILFLNKNCLDKFKLVIADNSSNSSISKKIKKLCEKNSIDYIKLPKNQHLQLSRSHGYTLNYLMKHFILKSKIKYFGLLDHDCFLIKKISFIEKLKKEKIRGALIDYDYIQVGKYKLNYLGNRRIIRPGCAFYDKKIFSKGYDFTPNKRYIPLSFLDTGGGNWKYVYKYYEKNELNLPKKTYDGEFEYINDYFFHIYGAGYRKEEIIQKGLKKLENYK